MDEVWERVQAELAVRKKGPAWLARKLECSEQRIHNWKTRGVPKAAYPEVAAALGWSIDRLAGVEAPAAAPWVMSAMARRIAQEFDRIVDDQAQLAAFAHIIGVIARAADGPPEPPTMLQLPSPSSAPTRDQ